MFVTTAGRTTEALNEYGKQVAMDLHIPFVVRRKQSIRSLQEYYDDDCIVAGKERLELHMRKSELPFFFHPNSANFRIKRLLKGEHDPFIDAAELSEGMSVLDCTMGLASDSITASFAVGETGRVVSLEGNKYLAYLVQKGLRNWCSDVDEMNVAMKRIQVHHSFYEDFFKKCSENMFDVVYFDPMFEESILTSEGIKALRDLAIYGGISSDTMKEAKRVARSRIVLKDHFRSPLFKEFNFQVYKRQSAKFHYGVITL
ncbi:class I SAM-dependent methyltransferase [Bacillus sp. FJAT-49736]|uniref:class I SAM-dependent methyltransferase n=1 Tax=Bacillus sp. FJAT-49736 TaxID=2833582 RepID=UPI001BCA25C7|nr:class I SAM-dependent methyltransferase [Bacillus sp. FJAT-49736]MBS4173199.1 class I SAM-dependent methyltransferase [Bacillus sp. FJAT-49736]